MVANGVVLVKSVVRDSVGGRLAELRTIRHGDTWITTVVLTEDFPEGPDVVTFNSWDAKSARMLHLGTADSIAGRDGKVTSELPGLSRAG